MAILYVVPINTGGEIAAILTALTQNVTGNLFLSLMAIFVTLIAICIGLGIPIEWTGIILLPLLLGAAAWYSDFYSILGVFLLYMGIVVANNFIFK